MIILSILIPTIPERGDMFTKLFNEVHRQLEYMQTFHPTLGQVEILVDDSKKYLDGGLSIGKKREALVKRAQGKYLCFLDADENSGKVKSVSSPSQSDSEKNLNDILTTA